MATDELSLRGELQGPKGLLASVIAVAVRDATGRRGKNRADAWRYLAGPVYEDHVTWLDLPPGILPARIAELAADEG